MIDADQWLISNDQYLSNAVAWLRARLEWLSKSVPQSGRLERTDPVPSPSSGTASRSLFRRAPKPVPNRPALTPPSEAAGDGLGPPPMLVPATDHSPALLLLGNRLGLSEFERNVLLLCVAMELDTRIAGLCARAQDDPAKPYPTFALVLALFDQPAWDVLSPERPLRYWRLIEINQPGAQPLTASPLRADERIVNYLKGLNYLDDRLLPMLSLLTPADDGSDIPASQQTAADAIIHSLQQYAGDEVLPVVQLLGKDGASKRMVAQRATASRQLRLYRLAAETLPSGPADLEAFARLYQRERMLLPIGLYLDVADIDRSDAQTNIIRRWLNRSSGLVFLDTREPWPGLEHAQSVVDVAKPSPAEQRDAWRTALGEAAAGNPAKLSGQFSFNVPTIRSVAADAMAGTGGTLASRLWDGCLMRARPILDQLAQRIDTKATWEDLKLPRQEMTLLRQIADQVGQRDAVYDTYGFRDRLTRGLGISVLFAGQSGTGKSMAAEVIANELGLLLYRIDLSAVVNKYIGETEKNLRKLFNAAEDGGVILFFDEADALFGKRSEVKDSHDRYANIETNYLLQRMEAYQGLAILATNMKTALDDAFTRRLRFIVNFPFPGAEEREAMWRRVLPPEQCQDLDFARLARLSFTGGSIQNVAINSAFLAARAADGRVTMPIVLDAARSEFVKMEKPINPADFRWLESAGRTA
jgi:hypothetical protein